eukprot:GHVL01039968.1.p1 GENE.GHVL01039968.1~~GHVL01039968.1.p1  ORF type:complete len:770 (+),score=212.46 GHVL01039968.1:17-2326(+)
MVDFGLVDCPIQEIIYEGWFYQKNERIEYEKKNEEKKNIKKNDKKNIIKNNEIENIKKYIIWEKRWIIVSSVHIMSFLNKDRIGDFNSILVSENIIFKNENKKNILITNNTLDNKKTNDTFESVTVFTLDLIDDSNKWELACSCSSDRDNLKQSVTDAIEELFTVETSVVDEMFERDFLNLRSPEKRSPDINCVEGRFSAESLDRRTGELTNELRELREQMGEMREILDKERNQRLQEKEDAEQFRQSVRLSETSKLDDLKRLEIEHSKQISILQRKICRLQNKSDLVVNTPNKSGQKAFHDRNESTKSYKRLIETLQRKLLAEQNQLTDKRNRRRLTLEPDVCRTPQLVKPLSLDLNGHILSNEPLIPSSPPPPLQQNIRKSLPSLNLQSPNPPDSNVLSPSIHPPPRLLSSAHPQSTTYQSPRFSAHPTTYQSPRFSAQPVFSLPNQNPHVVSPPLPPPTTNQNPPVVSPPINPPPPSLVSSIPPLVSSPLQSPQLHYQPSHRVHSPPNPHFSPPDRVIQSRSETSDQLDINNVNNPISVCAARSIETVSSGGYLNPTPQKIWLNHPPLVDNRIYYASSPIVCNLPPRGGGAYRAGRTLVRNPEIQRMPPRVKSCARLPPPGGVPTHGGLPPTRGSFEEPDKSLKEKLIFEARRRAPENSFMKPVFYSPMMKRPDLDPLGGSSQEGYVISRGRAAYGVYDPHGGVPHGGVSCYDPLGSSVKSQPRRELMFSPVVTATTPKRDSTLKHHIAVTSRARAMGQFLIVSYY